MLCLYCFDGHSAVKVLYWYWKIICKFPSNLMFASSFQKHGPRMKCSACKIIAHTSCISILMDRVKFSCKATFRDVGVRQYREQTCIHHHWVHRRSQKGKCKQCGKVGSLSFWGTSKKKDNLDICVIRTNKMNFVS